MPALIGAKIARICKALAPLATELSTVLAERVPHAVTTATAALEAALGDVPIAQTVEGVAIAATEMAEAVSSTIGTGACEARLALEAMHATLIRTLEPEIAALRPLFDGKIKGFLECANKCIKIDYKHILGMELKLIKEGFYKLSGFHHDFMNFVEHSGTIQFVNKIMYEGGFYSADVIIAGKRFPKTFFPAEWPREKVVSKIFEAYDNFIKSGGIPELTRKGKYSLIGMTDEGTKIEIFITKSGVIKTAYPLL